MKSIQIILSTLLLLGLCLSATAQDAKPKAMDQTSIKSFQSRLQQETKRIKSIKSDFKQIKYLDVFQEKLNSKGQFYYLKDDKIRFDYQSPVAYQMIINGQQLSTISRGKKSTTHLGSNPMMKEMRSMIAASMTGNLDSFSSSYRLQYHETPSQVIVLIIPLSKSVQAYIKEISLRFNKKTLAVEQVRLLEDKNNYSEYHFSNQEYNTLKGDEKFR